MNGVEETASIYMVLQWISSELRPSSHISLRVIRAGLNFLLEPNYIQ